MNPSSTFTSIVAASGLFLAASSFAAEAPKLEFPAPSPACTVKQRIGLTDVEVVYSRPGKKERTVFGGIVPYDKLWRTGANAPTKITFSNPVKLNTKSVPAGTYNLYTIPGEKEWTVILSKNLQASAFNYDEKDDLVRFKTEPIEVGEHVETFTIEFNHVRDESAIMYFLWDQTLVPIRVETPLTEKLVPQIEAAMSAECDQKPYYQAAMFYFDHDLDIQKARKWIEAASAKNETYYIMHLQAKILAKLGEKQKAISAAKRSSELAVKAEGPSSGYVKMNEELIAGLQ
jgi:hypothetical protein